eukprot:403352492
MRLIIKAFNKIRKDPTLIWKINLNVDTLVLEQFRKSKMVSLVTKFEINIPDLAGLMILPDILTVIQKRLLQDCRLQVDFKLQPEVILKNHVTIKSNRSARAENRDIVELIFKRSQSLKIDSRTYNNITMPRRFSSHKNVKKLIIVDHDSFGQEINQLIKVFPKLDLLDIGSITMDDDQDFFDCFGIFFRGNARKQIKCFKANIQNMFLFEEELKLAMDHIFQVVAGIDIPMIELTVETDCKVGFMNQFLSPHLLRMFRGYKVITNYINFGKRQVKTNDTCDMTLFFKKNIENQKIYTFDFTFKWVGY